MKRVWLGVLVTVAACSEAAVTPPSDQAESPRNAVTSTTIAGDTLVSTPVGPRYRSCVHEVPNGARIDLDGVVTRRNGSKFKLPRCAHPAPPNRTQPTSNGWVESAHVFQGILHQVTANWTVPYEPAAAYGSSQTFYTFPGMQSSSYVIQPVLQYGASAAGGGSYWAMASWRCNSGTDCYHSPLVGNVRPGDTMAGSVSAANCFGGFCDWTITTTDVTTGGTTTYTARDADNYSDGVGGAIEIWNLQLCTQLPQSGVSYTNVSFLDNSGRPITPSWLSSYDGNVVPQCGYQVTASGTNVTLADNQAPPPFTVTVTGGNPVAGGHQCWWTATVTGGGTPPYSYIWSDASHATLNPQSGYTQTWYSTVSSYVSPGSFWVLVNVTDSNGQTAGGGLYVQNYGNGAYNYDTAHCY